MAWTFGVVLLAASSHCKGDECSVDDDCDRGDPCEGLRCHDGSCSYFPVSPGSACDGGICSEEGDCLQCGAEPGDDPNDTQADATQLGSISDCEGVVYDGVTADGNDDWISFRGIDTPALSCQVLTRARVIARAALEVCLYWACDQVGVDAHTCPAGATEDLAPNGAFGCCAEQAIALDPCPDSFQDSSAQVWVRVRPVTPDVCAAYELDVEF